MRCLDRYNFSVHELCRQQTSGSQSGEAGPSSYSQMLKGCGDNPQAGVQDDDDLFVIGALTQNFDGDILI